MSRRPSKKIWVMLGGLMLAGSILPGCYERTVRAEGLGASGVQIQQPYVNYRWGKEKSKFKRMDVTPERKSSKPW